MTIKEYSDQFDTLLDSYKMPNGYGADETPVVVKLDEYEKSVFLSDAQTDLVVELYSGKNMYGGYFDSSEELRRYLSTLIRGGYGIMSSTSITLLNNAWSVPFSIPSDCLFILNEQATAIPKGCTPKVINVKPIRRDEYSVIYDNPFRRWSDILRVDLGSNMVELIYPSSISNYKLNYLVKPEPIILVDLTGSNLSIDEFTLPQTCKLHHFLHKPILDRAVANAINFMSMRNNMLSAQPKENNDDDNKE